MNAIRSNEDMKDNIATEFGSLVDYIIKIDFWTDIAFKGYGTIQVDRFVTSLVSSADIFSNITDD